jgi:hypothetical protein
MNASYNYFKMVIENMFVLYICSYNSFICYAFKFPGIVRNCLILLFGLPWYFVFVISFLNIFIDYLFKY